MSDHNPQDVETKRLPFAEAAPGAIGLETMLAAGLRLVHCGELDLMALLRAMSTRPAELLGLPGGTLAHGAPADVIVIDIDMPWVLDPAELKSKCKNTPFDEARLHRPRGAHHRRRPHGLRIRHERSCSPHRLRYSAICSARSRSASCSRALAGGPDLRTIGSGNIGATNVLRTGNKALAAATLVCDMLKGTAAVLLAAHFAGRDAALVPALGAFLGHLFPVWLKFKGGKGVATYIGVLLGLAWPAALVFGADLARGRALSRYSSLAALIASALTPLALWLFGRRARPAVFAADARCCGSCTAPISRACLTAAKARSAQKLTSGRRARS